MKGYSLFFLLIMGIFQFAYGDDSAPGTNCPPSPTPTQIVLNFANGAATIQIYFSISQIPKKQIFLHLAPVTVSSNSVTANGEDVLTLLALDAYQAASTLVYGIYVPNLPTPDDLSAEGFCVGPTQIANTGGPSVSTSVPGATQHGWLVDMGFNYNQDINQIVNTGGGKPAVFSGGDILLCGSNPNTTFLGLRFGALLEGTVMANSALLAAQRLLLPPDAALELTPYLQFNPDGDRNAQEGPNKIGIFVSLDSTASTLSRQPNNTMFNTFSLEELAGVYATMNQGFFANWGAGARIRFVQNSLLNSLGGGNPSGFETLFPSIGKQLSSDDWSLYIARDFTDVPAYVKLQYYQYFPCALASVTGLGNGVFNLEITTTFDVLSNLAGKSAIKGIN